MKQWSDKYGPTSMWVRYNQITGLWIVEETKLKTGKPKITNRKQNARACMHVAVCWTSAAISRLMYLIL